MSAESPAEIPAEITEGAPAQEVMIRTEGLGKSYGPFVALRPLDLQIHRGDVFGFIGPNGAGKTTTIRILATLIESTRGRAWVGGHDVAQSPVAVRQIIGYLPDSFGVYEDMVVTEYLAFFAAAYGIRGEQATRTIADVLELTDLGQKRDSLIAALSRGMQQRLGLARTLIHDPQVLLLDEPASGLDPGARIEVRELIKELSRMGKTILISSHILHELADLCNEVGIIEQGQLLYAGSVADVLTHVRTEMMLHVEVAAGDEERAAEILSSVPGVTAVRRAGAVIEVVLAPGMEEPWQVARAVIDSGLRLTSFQRERINLEDVFLRLTKGLVQ